MSKRSKQRRVFLKHIGRRLASRRRHLGISAREFSDSIGISMHQVYRYETGAALMNLATFWDSFRKLGVPPSYFFEGLPADVPETDDRLTMRI